MTDASIVSVVIPAGVVDTLLEHQLRAVLAQTGVESFEVIVSLNTSSAEASNALAEIVARLHDDRMHWVDSSDRRGAAHARNVGARQASAPMLAFCDGDDVVRPGWLAALVRDVTEQRAVSGRLVEFTDRGELPRWRPPATPGGLPSFLGVQYLLSGNMAITRSAFDAVGGFDETLTRCEDIGISWQLVKLGHELLYAADAVVDYRVRGSVSTMVRQHYWYGIGMSEVLIRIGRPGDVGMASSMLFRPNNQGGGLKSPIAVLRKGAIGVGRVVGIVRERRTARRRSGGRRRARPT